MTTIGTKIRKLRELRNYTQAYVAEQIGISQTAYSKMELDETNISQERLQQVAKALDLSVQDVLSFDEKNIFNFIGGQNPAAFNTNQNPVYNSEFSENERKLYEEKSKLMDELISYLKQDNEKLKAEIQSLKTELERLKAGK